MKKCYICGKGDYRTEIRKLKNPLIYVGNGVYRHRKCILDWRKGLKESEK